MSDFAGMTTDDLEPTVLGSPETPEPPKNRGGRPRSTVKPDEVIPPGSRRTSDGSQPRNKGGRKSKEQLESEAAERANAQAAELAVKIRGTVENMVNPTLASLSQVALQVPPEIPWLEVDTETQNAFGGPTFHYVNGAQMVIIQEYETNMLCMLAPAIANSGVLEKVKGASEKLAPVVMVGGLVAFAVSYGMRLRKVNAMLAPQRALVRRMQEAHGSEQGPVVNAPEE